MTPNTNEAMRFLRALGSPRTLVAIEPDSGRIVAGTPDTSQAVAAWIERVNATHGCYFTPNRTRRPMKRKPSKSDMAWADFAHVELDPPKGAAATDEWRRRLRYHITESLWPPTHLWRSGNGVQALWKLSSPVRIAGDPAAIARVESVNRALLGAFSGDDVEAQGTHNIDRLLRIPCMVNWPNKSKRQAGRKPVMAGEVYHDPTAVYALEDLPTAALAIDTAAAAITLEIGEPTPLERLSVLNVPDRLKQIIQHGRVPDRPKRGDDTRSAWEWDLICNLIRWRVPPETILGILLDPQWEISERVFDKPDIADARARQVIAKAHAQVTAERRADFDMLREPRPLEELLKEVFK